MRNWIELTVGEFSKRSPAAKDTSAPDWLHSFYVPLEAMREADVLTSNVQISIGEGQMTIPLHYFQSARERNAWFPLQRHGAGE